MKVTAVKTYVYKAAWNWLFVKIETDEGIYGWGEATTGGAGEACRGLHPQPR